MPTARLFLVAVFAIACQQAAAQTAVTTPALEVQRLGPHLVAFTGSQANFQNLVTGLAQGRPVQLVTVLPDGSTQLVTFTPATAMSPSEIVQMLETTRQGLIGLGIGTPTAEQLALALTGGAVPTPLGGSTLAGAAGVQTAASPAAQIQSGTAAAGATAPSTVTVQVLPPTAPRVNTSDSAIPAGATSRTPQSAPTSTTPQGAPTSTTPQGAPTSTTPPLAATPSPAPSSAPAAMSPGQAPPAFGAR